MSEPVRVVLVDDQDLIRSGLAMLVDSQPDLRVVGQAGDGQAGVDLVAATACDVVLMDVRMPKLDGVEATRRILAQPGFTGRVIVLTTFDLDEPALGALRAGASGFLVKDAPAEDVLQAIRTVHAGDAVIAPSTTRRLLDHVVPALGGATTPDPTGVLTDREREVFLAIARGATNTEVAQQMFLAEPTVKTHVGRILHKLELRDRVQIVILAYETGLVRPGE